MRGGRLFLATPGLSDLLSTFIAPGTRATVVDTNALKLGIAGTLALNKEGDLRSAESTWYLCVLWTSCYLWPS